ncbi:MacS family sensor histidine kinase [Actinocorallia longicatena]|uniref:DUF5931 domain-containing protein n=1 Tax=Actinocorallia longicatena TaxID=111803 RepID=A0ABP6QB17_9ACTN
MNVESALWRAIAVFRGVSLCYAAVLIVRNDAGYARPWAAWPVLVVMVLWTAFTIHAYRLAAWRGDERRRRALAVADLVIPALCLLATGFVEYQANLFEGRANLTVSWVAAPVMVWALMGGVRGGLVAATVLAVPDLALRGLYADHVSASTVNGIVLLYMVGAVIGYMARLALDSEARLARAIAVETATRERERLARDIHDSVLQVLALVQRRGGEAGGEAAELGRLAGEQEAALRTLIGAPRPEEISGSGDTDLRALLTAHTGARIQVSAPATPVTLPGPAAREVAAAVSAALDNVERHCPPETSVWILLEDDGDRVTVSVRDDGPGIPEGRMAEAVSSGRLGLDQSIRGRVRDLGGTVEITTAPGAGTDLELTIPRPRRS